MNWHEMSKRHLRLAVRNLVSYIRWGNRCFLSGWKGNLRQAIETWRWGNE